MWDLYAALVQQGFSPDQALSILLTAMAVQGRNG